METIKVLINYKGQTDSETLSEIYGILPAPLRHANIIRPLFDNALKVLKNSTIYECEFANSFLIFSHSAKHLEHYNVEIDICASCGKPMDAEEHNYGTDESAGDILICIHCYEYAQMQNELYREETGHDFNAETI